MSTELELTARIANPPPSLLSKYTRRERDFFLDYAEFVRQTISSDQVRVGLLEMMKVENFRVGSELDLRIMVFPARPLVGRPRSTLHGSYNQDTRQISLYPLKIPREWIKLEGAALFKTRLGELSGKQRRVLSQVVLNAVSTLIHEVLHVKFQNRGYSRYSEEAIVRKLERQYANEWVARLDSLNESPGFPGFSD